MKTKQLIPVLIYLFISTSALAQTDMRKIHHVFTFDVELNNCNFDGTPALSAKKEVMRSGWKFRIRNIVGDDYIIQVSQFTDASDASTVQNLATYQDANQNHIYFKLSKSDYLSHAEELKRRGSFVVGASTTLIKIRPGNGKDDEDEAIYSEFDNDFNIGVTAGWRITDYDKNISVSLVGGIGFSSIKVTPQTTRNFIDSESTQSCLTFSAGAIFEVEKFQISTFVGIDTMSGEVGKNWVYRNRPWLGIGFGYQIFKPKGATNN